ncbi:unnamed protein product [Paramecium sonneborni]|uniref:G domain-containing protein n=1 Tax=Paramecium sonneborni TaxID=65129 RepID=A0A8S1QLJ5_9CILI|nr:unnamed protein product [Paramecium sonneborni]
MGNLFECIWPKKDDGKIITSLQTTDQTNKTSENINNDSHYNKTGIKNQVLEQPVQIITKTKRDKKSYEDQPSQTICIKNINELEQQINDKDYLLLIGPTGVGKSKLFNQMKLEQINSQFRNRSKSLDDIKNSDINNETKIFKEGILGNQYIIVDTPSLQLQDDIDTRELIIKHFQDYISSRKYISSLAIVLNFERTDLMKNKALQVVKYLRKFIKIISIIIVNMELSENEEEDQQHLINSFKFIQYNQIIFIKKQMNQQQILEQIKKINFIKTKIDFEDTLFEMIKIQDEVRFLELFKPIMYSTRK